MRNDKFDYCINGEWRTSCYDDLNKDCKDIVNDLINSSMVCQHWSDEKKRMYFARVVTVIYELGRNKKRGVIVSAFFYLIEKFFCLTSKLAIYVR